MKKRDDKDWVEQSPRREWVITKKRRAIFCALDNGMISIWKSGRGNLPRSNLVFRVIGTTRYYTDGFTFTQS